MKDTTDNFTRVVEGMTWYALENLYPSCEWGNADACSWGECIQHPGMSWRECTSCCYTEATFPNLDRCEWRMPSVQRQRCQRLTNCRCIECNGAVCSDHVCVSPEYKGLCANCVAGRLVSGKAG